MQGPEPKTPSQGAPESGDGAGAVGTEPAENPPPEMETPRAASISRSGGELEKDRGTRIWKNLPFRARLVIAVAGGAALLGAAFASTAQRTQDSGPTPLLTAASLAATVAAAETEIDGGDPSLTADAEVNTPAIVRSVWRVAQLASDDNVSLVETTIGHRPLFAVLSAARLTPDQSQRVTQSLAAVRSVDRFDPKDALTLALDKTTARVVAYELTSSPSEVWQGREEPQPDGTTKIEAQKLKLRTERVRVGKALLVGADMRASFTEAGLTPVDDVLSLLDDALDGHAELSDIRPGARLRLLGTQEQVEGVFARWVSLDAVEYFPATPDTSSVRVYASADGEGESDGKKDHGWYDARGRQPFHGGFRMPVPLARIASRFNPHRMHPVLHVLMPHNGVDFAAPVGSHVYATAAGTVTSVGFAGPCGNKVEISHAGGITSVYCHLSRFAQGLHVGMHVEQRQLIAYVGQTGRVTGPHLHFGIRRNGVFVDPMTLRLDSVRVVPKALRDEFDRRRAVWDKELDGIPLPAPGSGAAPVTEPETFYEEP